MAGKAATAESGFIFSMPAERDHPLTSDTFYLRLLSWYLPEDIFTAIQSDLKVIAEESIGEDVRRWMCNAESQQPYVKTHNVWGARHDVDNLVTSEGWKQLRSWGMRQGVVAIGYEPNYGVYKRVVQHAKNYFFSPSSALTGCPLSMTDGAAKLLTRIIPTLPSDHPFQEVYRRLTDREQYWTSGQWMTERPGGSDVQNTETWATYSPLPNAANRVDQGDYLISGFKFFSSATDADIAVLLAKTSSGKLSAFLAPLTKTDEDGKTVTNGIRIHRLKQKLGTKQLPTAELELVNARAYLVGPLDHGVKTISDILNITRAHAFMGSCAGWRRCIYIAKAFSKSRVTWGVPLWLLPLHLRTLAELELKLRSCLHLAWFTISLLSFSENGFPKSSAAPLPTPDEAGVVLRTLTATTKAVSAKSASTGIQECMEAMGGVGYMDDPDEPENLARALRDGNVNTIWEGTTNVLSSEVVRNLQRKNHLELFSAWLERSIDQLQPEFRDVLQKSWAIVREELDHGLDSLSNGRRIMFSLSWVVSGLLFAADAARDKDEVAVELARRWMSEGGDWLLAGVGKTQRKETDRTRWDCKIVWGVELPDVTQISKI